MIEIPWDGGACSPSNCSRKSAWWNQLTQAAVPVHQSGPVQDEGAGADADERHACRGGILQGSAGQGGAGEVGDLMDQAADDDDGVEPGRVGQARALG